MGRNRAGRMISRRRPWAGGDQNRLDKSGGRPTGLQLMSSLSQVYQNFNQDVLAGEGLQADQVRLLTRTQAWEARQVPRLWAENLRCLDVQRYLAGQGGARRVLQKYGSMSIDSA